MTTPSRRRDPEQTRERLLQAATQEFSTRGYSGTPVDRIAARAASNPRMIYHYFGSKEGLYIAVLERVYAARRGIEGRLDVAHLAPREAMRALVAFNFAYCRDHPEFIRLVVEENLHKARHLRKSGAVRKLHDPLIRTMRALLKRGAEDGVFRSGIDPVQLYISIAALGFFYFSNNASLSSIFGRDLSAAAAVRARAAHVADFVLAALAPEAA